MKASHMASEITQGKVPNKSRPPPMNSNKWGLQTTERPMVPGVVTGACVPSAGVPCACGPVGRVPVGRVRASWQIRINS